MWALSKAKKTRSPGMICQDDGSGDFKGCVSARRAGSLELARCSLLLEIFHHCAIS